MKQFELKGLGLEEMSSQEIINTDGGGILLGLAIAAVLLLICQEAR